MTQDEIIEMARDSGMELYGLGKNRARFVYHLEAFAHLVATKEREALAQEQEPVAWRTFDGEGGYDYRSYEDNESYADDWNKRNPNHVGWVDKLYTHSQPEQEPVAYDKTEMNGFVQDLYDKKMQEGRHGHYETMFHVVHQAIKRATPPQRTEQEPVAWMFQHDETGRMNYVSNDGVHNPTIFLEMNPRYALVCPLYTTLPQRKFVGLTGEEIDYIYTGIRAVHHDVDSDVLCRAIEAKLKQKNGYAEEKNT